MNQIVGRWIKAGALIFVAALVLAGCEGASGVKGADGADGLPGADGADGLPGADGTAGLPGADGTAGLPGADGTNGTDGTDGTDGKGVIGFAYVAFNASNVVGTDPAPTGSLPIPFSDLEANNLTFTDHDLVDGEENETPNIATLGQCMAVTSIDLPMRYAAFGSNVPSHDVGLEEGPDMSTSGSFMVDLLGDDGFTGHANVLAGTYEYVLTASDESDMLVDSKDRRWDLHVTAAPMPGNNDDDPRSTADLHGAANGPEESAATAGDWANFVPAGFMVPAASPPALVDNVPRLSLPGTQVAPVGVTLGGEINSATDVDMFWLGSLAPNWKLELKVIGTSTVSESDTSAGIGDHNEVTLELHQHGGDMVALDPATTDASYDWEVVPDAMDGGLTCANYYIKVSGQEGRYTLAWKLSHPE